MANAELLEELLAWIQWAETTLIQRDQEPMPQNIDQVKALISEHQVSPVPNTAGTREKGQGQGSCPSVEEAWTSLGSPY